VLYIHGCNLVSSISTGIAFGIELKRTFLIELSLPETPRTAEVVLPERKRMWFLYVDQVGDTLRRTPPRGLWAGPVRRFPPFSLFFHSYFFLFFFLLHVCFFFTFYYILKNRFLNLKFVQINNFHLKK
jgi:hypothetical protein